MKILNILEAQYQTDFKHIDTKGNLKKFSQAKALWNQRDDPNVAQGYFSAVRQNRTDPHLVTKTSKRPYAADESDSFGEFIKFIYEHDYQDNIHMPRVYNWKELRDSDGNKVYKYEIEKLVNGKDIDPEQIEQYIRRVLPESELTKFDLDYTVLADFVSNEIMLGDKIFKQKQLNDACAIIAEAIRELGVERDIHFNNIMFRQDRYGIQLVFSDPVA